VIDTILASGHSAVAAMERIQEFNPKSMKFICLISSPEGIDIFHRFYPDIPIYTLSVDRQLNEKGFIWPGFGDTGDRIFGNK
jgi:uracil phosphoribosyltransferase